MALWGHPPQVLAAQELVSDGPFELVHVGIEGKFKVGDWTPVHLVIDGSKFSERVRIELATVDSDGVAVTCSDDLWLDPASTPELEAWKLIRVGRLRSNLEIRLLNQAGEVVASTSRLLDPDHGARPSTQQFVLTLGPDIGFENWLSDRQGRFDDRDTDRLMVVDYQSMPRDVAAYESVDLMIVSLGTDPSILSNEQKVPWSTVAEWVDRGGTLILTGATLAQPVANAQPEFGALIPGKPAAAISLANSGGAEVFTSATDRLLDRGEVYQLAPLTEVHGKIWAYESQDNTSYPLVVDSAKGMGRVLWIATDLEAEPFASWVSRSRFIGKLLEMVRNGATNSGANRGGRVKHLGFDDLSGQLRAALDGYSRVSLVTFTGVAVVVIAFILLIGPLDWWLLSRWIGRMEWTWATSGGVVLLITLLAIVGFRLTKGDQVLANQLEMIDVDASTGEVRGTVWAHLYSPRVRTFDLGLQRDPFFVSDQGRTLLTWQGLSGNGLGGMDVSASSSTAGLSGYQMHTLPDNSSELQGIAVQVASTRSFVGRWWDQLDQVPTHHLYLDRRNNSLHGDFENPFPFTLEQAIVFYDTWAYVVNEDIQPGESISIEGQTTERTVEGLLARRQLLQGTERSEPWDPANRQLSRIAEMLAFHRAAGGRDYTTLHHRVFGEVDWSSKLKLGQAVIYARAASNVSTLTDQGEPMTEAYDQRVSVIRLLVPVADNDSRTPQR